MIRHLGAFCVQVASLPVLKECAFSTALQGGFRVLTVVLSHDKVRSISISLTHDIKFVFLGWAVLGITNAIIIQLFYGSVTLEAASQTSLDQAILHLSCALQAGLVARPISIGTLLKN